MTQSVNGTTIDFVYTADGMWPAATDTYELGLSNRHWERVHSLSFSAKTAFEYANGQGVGGDVTQTASKSTAVTINKRTGRITTHNSSLAAGATVIFEVNNSTVAGLDNPQVWINAATINYFVLVVSVSAGRFAVALTNTSAGVLSEAIPIIFALGVKGAIT